MFEKILNFFRKKKADRFLVDLTILEDGRILNIIKLDFLDIKITVPQFVIEELNKNTASRNLIKRNRAKRGLDVLERLKEFPNSLQIISKDFDEIKDYNQKFIALAQHLKMRVFSADFKLIRAALSQKIKVLSMDTIDKAFKQIYLPGESIMIFLAKEGAQANQAVGYLDDGTMVIAEDARKCIGKRVELFLTSVIQSSSGRMFFGKVSDEYIEQINESYKKRVNN